MYYNKNKTKQNLSQAFLGPQQKDTFYSCFHNLDETGSGLHRTLRVLLKALNHFQIFVTREAVVAIKKVLFSPLFAACSLKNPGIWLPVKSDAFLMLLHR